MFCVANPVFREVLLRRQSAGATAVAFIDANVAAKNLPSLSHGIAIRVRNGDAMRFALPESVAGGEPVKNGPAVVTRLQQRLVDLGVDRHSFVVGVGGGAFLDGPHIGYVCATTTAASATCACRPPCWRTTGVGVRTASTPRAEVKAKNLLAASRRRSRCSTTRPLR